MEILTFIAGRIIIYDMGIQSTGSTIMSIVTIAKKAGVGIGTVSRYINDRSKVSTETAEKIAVAMAETDFHPRLRRPGPKTKERAGTRTGVIVFLTIGHLSPEMMFTMPAFPMLLTGIQRSIISQGFTLMFANVAESGKVPEIIDEKYCDGIIIQSFSNTRMGGKLSNTLKSRPVVWCFREHCDFTHEFDHVFYNNAAVGTLAGHYMRDHGHRQTLYVNADAAHPAFRQRQEIFIGQCKEDGIQARAIVSRRPSSTPIAIHCRDLTEQFMALSDRPSGIFFCSDDAMLGVYNELRADGFNPSGLDMLGCNNEAQFLNHIDPRPSSIDIRLAEVGEMTVQRLLQRINGTVDVPGTEILINPRIEYGVESPENQIRHHNQVEIGS